MKKKICWRNNVIKKCLISEESFNENQMANNLAGLFSWQCQ